MQSVVTQATSMPDEDAKATTIDWQDTPAGTAYVTVTTMAACTVTCTSTPSVAPRLSSTLALASAIAFATSEASRSSLLPSVRVDWTAFSLNGTDGGGGDGGGGGGGGDGDGTVGFTGGGGGGGDFDTTGGGDDERKGCASHWHGSSRPGYRRPELLSGVTISFKTERRGENANCIGISQTKTLQRETLLPALRVASNPDGIHHLTCTALMTSP